MFNHECAQRNGEVVGACMDGFLFGACCQVPSNQQPEHTLINDAQNSYYHQYQNQKLQQQETETNKIVSQAYETFAENSAQHQSLENSHSQTQESGDGANALSSLYNVQHMDDNKQGSVEPVNTRPSSVGTTETTHMDTNFITQLNTETPQSPPRDPPKISVHKDSVKISSPSQSPPNDDFVLQVLNTLSPNETNKIAHFTTEVPTKLGSGLTEQTSSESNSFEEEPAATTKNPSIVKPEATHNTESMQQYLQSNLQQNDQPAQQLYLDDAQNHYTESAAQQSHTEAIQHDPEELFGGVSFTHSDITHPGADTDLIDDDLQFSTGYGPQPVFLPAPSKPNELYGQQTNKHTSSVYDATTSSSSITTHVDSIETIIQQLNNSNPGPTYNVINHHDQRPHQETLSHNADREVITQKPISYDEDQHTKQTSIASLSYNKINHNNQDKPNAENFYGHTSALSSSTSGSVPTTNTFYSDEFVLEDQTMPSNGYNDYQASKHPTSDFNKMPAIGIAYPVDMSFIEEGDNLNLSQQADQQPNTQNSYTSQQQQYHTKQQQPNIQASLLSTYSTQADENNFSHPQPVQNYITQTQQRPVSSHVGMVTSQSYSPQPLPDEVVVSSHTTKIEENAEVSTEYKPIITTNQLITTSYKATTKPAKQTVTSTLITKRPTLVTKKPSSKKPTKATYQRPTTTLHVTTNSVATQQLHSTSALETKTPSPAESLHSRPTASYSQGIQQDYIISSGSTPKPILIRQPTKNQNAKPASTSYITGPTTPRPIVTPQLQYDQEAAVIQADDKLDLFVLSTAESLASAAPTQETLSYDPPVYLSAGSPVQNPRPIPFNGHKKPGFVKVQVTQKPPVPTVLITPKPTSLQTTASSFTTAQHTSLSGYDSTSFVYNPLATARPDVYANDYVGISTVNSNDFDDPGYYGSQQASKPARPVFFSGSTEALYPIPTDDKPAFPGYYGPTPTYPAFQVPGEKLESPLEEQVYTSPNDFVNFPPVRNPNLNMSATSSAVTSDFALSTPAFVEDNILKNKMNTLVHKIVESLQGNFDALADMIDDNNNTAAIQTYQASTLNSTAATKKPTRKPTTKGSTAKPKATTKKPITRVTSKAPTKKPGTTRKPETTTKRQAVRRTTTTTKRPASRKPTRRPTTTTAAPSEDDFVDEEDEEDVNPSENEIVEEESYGAGGSGRKIRKFEM